MNLTLTTESMYMSAALTRKAAHNLSTALSTMSKKVISSGLCLQSHSGWIERGRSDRVETESGPPTTL